MLKIVNMHIGERIKQIRKTKGIRQKELANKLNLRQSVVSSWERKVSEPNPENRKKLCEVLKISEAELFGGLKTIEIQDTQIPIVSRVGATDEKGHAGYLPLNPPYETINFKNCKAVIVESNSMAPIAYKGQKIIYCENMPIQNGDLVFVKLKDGDQLFKRYHKEKKNKVISFLSINIADAYEPIVVKDEEIEFIHKVVGIKF